MLVNLVKVRLLLKSHDTPAIMPTMKFFISLIGMVLILEALPYIAFPDGMKQWLRQLSEMESGVLRVMGLMAMAGGLFLCYIAQRSGLF